MFDTKRKSAYALRIAVFSVLFLYFSLIVGCSNIWATSKDVKDDNSSTSFKPTQEQLDAMNSGITSEKIQEIENDIDGLEYDVVQINSRIDEINEIINTPQQTSDDGVSLTPVQQAAVNSGITASKVEQIETNKTNITTNAQNISTNADSIAANTQSITTNTENIATNTQNISTNTQNISNHTANKSNPHNVTKAQVGLGDVVNTGDSATPVSGGTTKFTTGGAYTELNKKIDKTSIVTTIDANSTNTQIPSAKSVWDSFLSIQENSSSFSPVQAQLDAMNSGITSNKVNQIETNKNDIATNTQSITTNSANIATNTQNISTNAGNISANTQAITTNTANIATNTQNITVNTGNIAANTQSITTNTENIATNTQNISTNTQNISNHTSNTSNPHNVTKAQVGLGDVVNTGDSATPVSGGTTKFTTGGAYTELNKKLDKPTQITPITNKLGYISTDSNGLITSFTEFALYEHHWLVVWNDYAQYPSAYATVRFLFPDNTSRTYIQLAEWLYNNGFNDTSRPYGNISGVQNTHSRYVSKTSGGATDTLLTNSNVAVGLFSPDGETIKLQYNYGSSASMGADGDASGMILKEFNKIRII